MTLGTLYSSSKLCPFSQRVLVAAAELQVDVDVVYGDAIPEEVRASNDSGSWPAFLPRDGELLTDSGSTVEHLIGQAGARGDAYRVDDSLLKRLESFAPAMGKVICAGSPKVQKVARAELEGALEAMAVLLDEHEGAYLAGAEFSQADGHLVPFLHRLGFVAEMRAYCPKAMQVHAGLRDWIDRVTTRASFSRVAPTMAALRRFFDEKATYGKPMKVGRLHHSAFRAMWDDMQERLLRLASSSAEDGLELQEVRGLCVLLFRAVALHGKFENFSLFPTLNEAKGDPGFTEQATVEHTHEAVAMNALLALFDEAVASSSEARPGVIARLARASSEGRESFFAHLAYEEANFMPVLSAQDMTTHLRLLNEAYAMCLAERPHLIGVIVAYMPKENRLSMIDSLSRATTPDHPQWRLIMNRIHQFSDEETWLRIVHKFEDIVPTSLKLLPAGHERPSFAEAARAVEEEFPLSEIVIPEREAA